MLFIRIFSFSYIQTSLCFYVIHPFFSAFYVFFLLSLYSFTTSFHIFESLYCLYDTHRYFSAFVEFFLFSLYSLETVLTILISTSVVWLSRCALFTNRFSMFNIQGDAKKSSATSCIISRTNVWMLHELLIAHIYNILWNKNKLNKIGVSLLIICKLTLARASDQLIRWLC